MVRTTSALVLGLTLLVGCSSVDTFEGSRSDDQVAVIVPENHFNRRRDLGPFGTSMRTGEVRVRVAGESLGGFAHSFRVLPGRHDLAVVFVDDRTPYPETILRTREVTLRLDARAGHTYGKAYRDVVRASYGQLDRPPDVVAFPTTGGSTAGGQSPCGRSASRP